MSVGNDRREHFDNWATRYDESVSHRDGYPFAGYRNVLDRIVTLTRPHAGARILDLGVGTGALSERFVKQECHVWGLDFSEGMLVEARKRCPRAEFFRADLTAEWPSALTGPFDGVVSAYVFHHFTLAEKIRLIERAMTHVTAEGRIVIGDIAFSSREHLAAASKKWKARWDPDEFYWAWDETREACASLPWSLTVRQISECAGVLCVEHCRAHRADGGAFG
jgi:putative AdoMet-dependent methyltransferase